MSITSLSGTNGALPFGPSAATGAAIPPMPKAKGANGASAADSTTGPEPGPPPPCGVEKVLCRLMCIASMPRSPGLTRPAMALKLAPSQ